MDTLSKGMIPRELEQDSVRFHDATQDSAQFLTYELLISVIFH